MPGALNMDVADKLTWDFPCAGISIRRAGPSGLPPRLIERSII